MFTQPVRQFSGVNSWHKFVKSAAKARSSGNNISHAHNVTKRRWNINLRPVHAKTKTGNKRMRVCTGCLRSGKVVKA